MISIVSGPPHPVMGLADWKALARGGRAPEKVTLRKAVAGSPIAAAEDRTVRFTISTVAVDRDGDTIDPQGWDLRNWKLNPVVLWAHDYSALPVAKGTDAKVQFGRLLATAEFPDESTYAFGATVFRLLKEGFLRATSVGFSPVRWTRNEERGGIDFHEQELLEFSIVPVGANPEALVAAQAKGYDAARVRRWLSGTATAPVLVLKDAGREDLVEVDKAWLEHAIRASVTEQIRAVALEAAPGAVRHVVMMVTGKID